ncbi:MAG: DUF72 domain-containing protein [Proteobacteria bacterium]|nr:DUF72 domain-containing protein [Pseudomonadota bacterium]NIS71231.1 DUF72 domain-containing protein [Pseudomonadota bacterium]
MTEDDIQRLNRFQFRDLHPNVFLGTTSDRYAGWIGQIYSVERFGNRITSRTHSVGGKSFKEEVLPVESVVEYFEHFPLLELDFTFYRVLLDRDLRPTQNFRVLESYRRYLKEDDRLFLKVPQVISAQRLRGGDKFVENLDYLNPEIFTHQFYQPAIHLLGDSIRGFIFEQEYQPKKERGPQDAFVRALDEFFGKIPRDSRYHLEVRTDALLSPSYFDMLQKHGIGQVLSHWTWLPPLRKQYRMSGNKFLNSGNQCIIRLMTPLRMRYADAYIKAFPFDRMIDGMMTPQMIEETVDLMSRTIDQGVQINVAINNRAGGNAPIIAQKISEKFLEVESQKA